MMIKRKISYHTDQMTWEENTICIDSEFQGSLKMVDPSCGIFKKLFVFLIIVIMSAVWIMIVVDYCLMYN